MKILICEDDSLNLKFNKALVEDYFEKRNAHNVNITLKRGIHPEKEALDWSEVDIAILDIDLKNSISGLKIARLVKEQNPYVALIFITSYDNYALDAWKLHSLGFLQKPVKPEDFNDVFSKAILQFNGLNITKMNRLIEFNSNKTMIKERHICCVEKISGTKDVKITTNREVFTFRDTIKDIQKNLCEFFVRINRTTLINIYYIFKIDNGVVELSNEKVFNISPNREKELRKRCLQLNINY